MEHFFAHTEIFKKLPAAQRQHLAGVSREKRYAKGETVFRAGEPADAVCVVKEGRVHLMKFLEGGQVSTTCVMTPGETFCCLPALDRKPYPVDAIAAVDSIVVRIPIAAFHKLLQEVPDFLQTALCVFCERLRQVEDKGCTVYDSVERRLAQALLTLSKKFGPTIPLTKHELAELANTTVETTIRILSQLKSRGIVRSSRGSTTIAKPAQLEQLASS
ncbi:MAG: Crp/Fnr family transcriptional regulator [Candidatus Omnitrophica bacterium]|nr:Crp/Fnr family transcriptional regulator [Candidatus Omnitrophota bacterium]MBI3021129.1 Crp/Fnr family transcriptional regulator [Candidatus Omnitrophota bacterium]